MAVEHELSYGSWITSKADVVNPNFGDNEFMIGTTLINNKSSDVGVYLSVGGRATIISFEDWEEIVKTHAVPQIANILGITSDQVKDVK
jgi:hypothetical protein